jgi:hypothetical protein
MKLTDFIHYYFGCQCLEAIKVPGQELNFEPSIVTVRTLFNVQSQLSDVKLVLRRLEDITDDEWLDIEQETSIAPDAIGWYGVRESIMTTDTRHRFHWTVTNEVLIILRKRGVDVDNLIKNNLAIDAKTIK